MKGDNLEMSQQMKKLITSAGYQCITIQNREQAVAICLEQNPDIIIINSQLSNTKGYQVCRQLRQLSFFRYTPIIMLADKIRLFDKIRVKISQIVEILPKLPSNYLSIITLFKSLAQEFTVS